MGQILFFYGSIVILVIFLVKEFETVPCQVDCKNVKCPANCTCTEKNVNCHGRDLTYIPCIPSGITHLNLSNSSISILSINEIKNLACSFETLTHMILMDCKIKLFVGDVFINLTHLEVLDLSFNDIVSNQKESIQRALGSLNRAPLQKLKLDRLLIQNGVQEIFKYFDGRHLTHLSMRVNQIQEFEDKVLENFTKLAHLDLHGNWITKINLSSGVETLELFNLSHNQINIFPPIFCDHKTGETHYKNLKNLDLSWNQIIVPYSQNWNCLKTLETLNLSRNDMEDIGNNDSFSNLTSLKTLILSEMRFSLTRIRKKALKSDSLQHLDLSGNGLNFENRKEVDDTVFHYLPNLTFLDVSDNDLGSDGAKKLTNLSRLETLIMRHVNLRSLPDDLLGHFPNLKYLDLYRNKIEQFSANAFQNVRLMEVLNISDNLISTFPVPPLPSATLKSLKKFDFAYNYFLCDCEIVKLQKWINKVLSNPNKTKLISRYPDQYWCYKPQPLYQVLLNVAEPTHCKNIKYQLLLNVVCPASICVVFTVFLVVAYVYRWKIKLFLHKMRHNKRDGYHPLTYTFEYNTYVVYAEKDSAWVIHDLLKDLEEAKYKAYTRDRDSVPGVARCDEIVDNIYKSKTVIFVLSKNFLACQWCLYQLNVAQARAVKLGPHFMIPVLLEGINTKHMKKSVQHLFRTSKPIEWARQSTKNKLFWSELKTALDEDLNDEFEETGYQSFDADYASIGT